jgi:hypothetical protein
VHTDIAPRTTAATVREMFRQRRRHGRRSNKRAPDAAATTRPSRIAAPARAWITPETEVVPAAEPTG